MNKHEVRWLHRDDIIHQTSLAIKVENYEGEEVWLPKSQLEFYEDGTISVPLWLADDKQVGDEE